MKKTAIAVAGLAATITFGTMVSPTFANYVNSLFNTVQDADGGMKKAAVEGYIQTINKQVTDQGITVIVKEALADPTRIALIFDFVDKDGKKLACTLDDIDVDFTLTDETGQDLNPEGDGWTLGEYGGYILVEQEVIELFNTAQKSPDTLTVGVQFNDIKGKGGSWKLDVPIDMKKAKEVAKTVAINREYTSPQGVVVKLDKLTNVPSNSLLSLTTSWSEQRKKEYQSMAENASGELGDYLNRHSLAYEILDENGKLLAGRDDTVLDSLNGVRKNAVTITTKGEGDSESDAMMWRWWDGFTPFADQKKVTFKLHSIYLNELATFQGKLSLDALSKQPVTVESSGSRFTFHKFHLKTNDQQEKIAGRYEVRNKGGIIEFEALLPKDIIYITEWSATDETGKTYRVSMDNGDGEYVRDQDGRVRIKSALYINGLEKQPKELTISYAIQERQYRDVDMEVPIQLGN